MAKGSSSDKDVHGDMDNHMSKAVASKAMSQLDKSDITADINGVADSRASTDMGNK